MRVPFILFVTFFVMVPLVYVLFFTTLVDNLLIKLRARQISKADAEPEKVAARGERSERDETFVDLDKIIAELDKVRLPGGSPKTSPNKRSTRAASLTGKTSRNEKPFKPWAVRNTVDPDLFWSGSGWVTKAKVHRFDADEKAEVTLPECGKWYRFRNTTTK